MSLNSKKKANCVPVSYNCSEMFSKPPTSNCFQVIMIERGCATLRINSERCFLQSGVIIFRGKSTVIDLVHSHKLIAKSITFDPKFFDMDSDPDKRIPSSFNLFYDLSCTNSGILPLDPLVCPKATSLFAETISEIMNQNDALWYSRVRINMIELFRLAKEEFVRFSGKDGTKPSLARSTLNFIHTNYEKEITVRLLCELFHPNHTTLLCEFRKLTGTTIGQYVLEYRLHLVREALIFTNLTIEEIAEKFGFRQASYLSRVFRARTGVAPGRFRAQMSRYNHSPTSGFTDVSG